MKTKFLGVSLFVLSCLIAGTLLSSTADHLDLRVHEWGTFTSVAGENGLPTSWRTYGGREDLPCFVNSFGGFKEAVPGTVRMETPVLYFYSPQEMTTNVKVLFPGGTITEWFPQSAVHPNESIEWRNVRISPKSTPEFPEGTGPSHYYTARQTDASPLQTGGGNEKFLFYRGVGNFPLPISAKVTTDGQVLAGSVNGKPIDGVILFENRAGQRRYRLIGSVQDEVTVDRESLQDNWAGLLMDLERVLIDHGLYQREARAMIETWRDSWFEEGTRLFYIFSKQSVDSALPLTVQPAPAEVTRVFVGRMEIITPEIQDDVRQAVAEKDLSPLERYGRFLQPIAQRIGGLNDPLLNSAYKSYDSRATTCAK
jgi:hypothetical protein